MALDATVAGVSANSYLTVAEADTLNGTRLGPAAAAWSVASLADKEKALISATRDVDANVRPATPYSALQALAFPRATDLDAADLPILAGGVKLATYEQAVYLLDNATALDEAASRRARGLYQFTDDDVSGSIALDPLLGLLAPRAQAALQGVTLTEGSTRIGSARLHSPTRAAAGI